ncbi:MAG: hypothetical protein K2X47_18655, partial [Bdellovibrionales bacterium]|nr:hypothetical protein [Bdellovibrionales bacterium]
MYRLPALILLFHFLVPLFSVGAEQNQEPSLKPIKLEWAQVPKAKTYRIQIAMKSDFSSTVVDEPCASNTFTWTTYQPGIFFWRVAAITEGSNLGTWSSAAELDIKPKAVSADDFLSFDTQLSDGNRPAAVNLQWKGSSFAKSYEIEIWKADGKRPILTQTIAANKLSFTPDAFGAYSFRVKTLGKGGQTLGDWSAQIPFSVNPKKGEAGVSAQWFYPAGVVLYADDPTQHLTWPPILGTTRSEIEFSDRADFSKGLSQAETSTNQIPLPPRNPGKVFWRWRRYVGERPLGWIQSWYVVSPLESKKTIWQSPEKSGGSLAPLSVSWNLGLSETPLDRRIKMFHLSKADGLVNLRLARTPIHTRETKMELLDHTGSLHTTIPSDFDSGTIQAQSNVELITDPDVRKGEGTSDAL